MLGDVLAFHASPTLPAARVSKIEVARSRTLPVNVLIHRKVGLLLAIIIMVAIAGIVPISRIRFRRQIGSELQLRGDFSEHIQSPFIGGNSAIRLL